MVMNKKRIVADVALNIVATAIPIVALNIIVLPLLAAVINSEVYGLALSLISLLSLCPDSFGNVLNNVRLLHNEDGNGLLPQPNYSVLTLILSAIGAIVVLVVAIVYEQAFTPTCIILAFVAMLMVIRGYLVVAYRLKLDFKAILLNNVFLTLGYFAGLGLFYIFGNWAMIYLCGQVVSLIYVICTTSIWRDPLRVTTAMKGLLSEVWLLLLSGILGRLTTYADRIVLFPLIGGHLVSIYYVSTLFGKMLAMLVGPLNSVVLSYLSRMRNKPDRIFWLTFASAVIVCVVAYFLTLLVSRPILSLLYPQFVDEAMRYVWLVTISAYIATLSKIINPFVMKFFPLRWQPLLSGGFSVVYIAVSLLLLAAFGLWGFCAGVLIADIAKLIALLLIYVKGKPNQLVDVE